MRMSLGRQSSMPKAEQKYNITKDKKLKTVRSVTRVSRLKRSSDYRSLMFTQHLYLTIE